MDWTLQYFWTQAKSWNEKRNKVERDLGCEVGGNETDVYFPSTGHICYTSKQEALWLKFAELATDKFNMAKGVIRLSECT
jgi:hypothetical protein